jgi:hypothetical protein
LVSKAFFILFKINFYYSNIILIFTVFKQIIMDANIHRLAIQLSNNSILTGQAAVALSKLQGEDLATITKWLGHAVKEQDIKIANAKRKLF